MARARRAKRRRMIATKNSVNLRAQTEISVREGSSDSAHGPFHVGDAAAILDLLLDVDASGENYFERVAKSKASEITQDAYVQFARMLATLNALIAHAVAIRKADKPRLFSKVASLGWLRSGIRVVNERRPSTWSGDRVRYQGDAHYHCAFCDENLATLGFDDGVRRVAHAFELKLERHARACAMRFLLDLHMPPRLAETEER